MGDEVHLVLGSRSAFWVGVAFGLLQFYLELLEPMPIRSFGLRVQHLAHIAGGPVEPVCGASSRSGFVPPAGVDRCAGKLEREEFTAGASEQLGEVTKTL